jgi:glycosyltransferase involved in cell wall biosynthesis
MIAADHVSTPAFAVVIPLFNKRHLVRATLESVLAQRLAPAEVIVVDDGSTDGSPDVVADLLRPPVRLVRQANAGPGPARNRGVQVATAPWIAFIDADDLWHPEHLATLAETIAAVPDADLVATATRWQPASAVNLALPALADPRPRALDYFRQARYGSIHTSSVAVRRAAFLETDGFGAFIPGEDVEFWTRFALDHRVAQSPVPTSVYLRANDGIMDHDRGAYADTAADTPFYRLIARALADPRYRDRHAAIADFADRAALSAARNRLYVGNAHGARAMLSVVRRPGPLARLYRAACYLPRSVLRRGAAAYSRVKAARRRALG